VKPEGFNRYLTRKLCWRDGSATHASSALQRQCNFCRRKWSYEALAKQWVVAQEYCAGHTRQEAAKAAKVGQHTAGRHYASFERALDSHLRLMLRKGEAWKLGDTEKIQAEALRKSSRKLPPRRQRSLPAELCFEHLRLKERVALLFELVFLPKVRRRVGK